MLDKWSERFAGLAGLVATWSKDPSTQVGAVIVRPDRTVVSMGFNGFPRGTSDEPSLYEAREVKYERVVHAELNAILTAREPLHGTTLYATCQPCARCAAAIIQAGITEVVARRPSPGLRQRLALSFEQSEAMFKEAGVTVRLYD